MIGLGFPSISVNKAPTAFQNLITQGLIDKAEFAFYLSDGTFSKGELVLGGTDPQHYIGDFHYVPLISETYWAIQLDDLVLDGESYVNGKGGEKAIVDTGTSLLAGPKVYIYDDEYIHSTLYALVYCILLYAFIYHTIVLLASTHIYILHTIHLYTLCYTTYLLSYIHYTVPCTHSHMYYTITPHVYTSPLHTLFYTQLHSY